MYIKAVLAYTGGAVFIASSLTWLIHAQVSKPEPLTIRYTETKKAVLGASKQPEPDFKDTYFMRRADGSTVQVQSKRAPDSHDYQQRFIEDVGSAQRIVLDAGTQSKTTYKLSTTDVKELKNPPSDCSSYGPVSKDEQAFQSFLGYRVLVSTTEVPTAERRRIDTWRTPDLACIVLRKTVWGLDASGKATEILTKEAISVTLGDPDPAMFEVPDWPERTPSEVFAVFAKKFNVDLDSLASQKVRNGLDKAYSPAPQPIPPN